MTAIIVTLVSLAVVLWEVYTALDVWAACLLCQRNDIHNKKWTPNMAEKVMVFLIVFTYAVHWCTYSDLVFNSAEPMSPYITLIL